MRDRQVLARQNSEDVRIYTQKQREADAANKKYESARIVKIQSLMKLVLKWKVKHARQYSCI